MQENRWVVPIIFLVAFAAFYCTAMPLLDDPDVPWHLATADLLWSTHKLPATDPWSFASAGAPWYLLSWGWDLLLGVPQWLGGAFGVFIFSTAICAGLIAFTAWRLLSLKIAPAA